MKSQNHGFLILQKSYFRGNSYRKHFDDVEVEQRMSYGVT